MIPRAIPMSEIGGFAAGCGLLAMVAYTPSIDASMAEGMRREMMIEKGEVWLRVGGVGGAPGSNEEASGSAAQQNSQMEAALGQVGKIGSIYRRYTFDSDNSGAPADVDAKSSRRSSSVQRLSRRRNDGSVSVVPPESIGLGTRIARSDEFGMGLLYRRLIRGLSSFPLALAELAVLAFLSAAGTWLEQGLTYDAYSEKLYNSRLLATAVTVLGFDHMFTSPVFLGTALLLAMSLASCSMTRQLPLVKVAKRWRMINMSAMRAMDVQMSFGGASGRPAQQSMRLSALQPGGDSSMDPLMVLASHLAAKKYNVFIEDEGLYAFKGLAGRVAPIAVHVSMLAIMLGSTVGALTGASGDALIPEGGVASTAAIMRQQTGPLHNFQADERLPGLMVNEFRIEYNDNGDIDQFYSDLSVIEADGDGQNAHTVLRKTISVNDPLRYDGLVVYQDTWALNSIEVSIDGDEVVLPMVKLDPSLFGVGGDIWGAYLPLGSAPSSPTAAIGVSNPSGGAVILARDFQTAFIYNTDGSFVGARRPGSRSDLTVPSVGAEAANEHRVKVTRIGGSTGLRLKQDPGVPLVYLGFAALLISTLLSYESHSQVWACVDAVRKDSSDSPEEDAAAITDLVVSVGGKTNRAKVSFREEMDDITSSASKAWEFLVAGDGRAANRV